MGGLRLLAALASIGLGMSSAAATPSPEAPEVAPVQPCPTVELDPPPPRPEPPEPPEHSPGDRQLGGAALATTELVVPADSPTPPASTADSWLVADLDSGAVLGGCAPHQHGIPASTLKLLLAAAFLPELDPDREVEVLAEDLDFEPGSSAVGLLAGGVYRIETLWLGLLLSSGNDAANVLARLGGGDDGVEGGLRRMNAEARRLGAYQTHAATPSGLDGPGQFTSAYDLAVIARQLFDREDFRQYVATERTEIPAQPPEDPTGFQIQNDNGLLLNYPGALGGKTGFTDLARHSFVGAAERDGRRLVVTLLGAEARPVRSWQQAAQLLDWGFDLPVDAAVGRLLTPADLAADASSTVAPSTPPTEGGAGGASGQQAAGGSTVALATVILAASAVVAAGLLVMTVRLRRR